MSLEVDDYAEISVTTSSSNIPSVSLKYHRTAATGLGYGLLRDIQFDLNTGGAPRGAIFLNWQNKGFITATLHSSHHFVETYNGITCEPFWDITNQATHRPQRITYRDGNADIGVGIRIKRSISQDKKHMTFEFESANSAVGNIDVGCYIYYVTG